MKGQEGGYLEEKHDQELQKQEELKMNLVSLITWLDIAPNCGGRKEPILWAKQHLQIEKDLQLLHLWT